MNITITENSFDLFDENIGANEKIKIVFISDIHTKDSVKKQGYVDDVIRSLNAQEPDLILIGGDTVDGQENELQMLEFLGKLKSKHGIYAVLGNHDYRDWDCKNPENVEYANRLEQKIEEQGIIVLRNEHKLLEINGQEFALIGLDSYWACQTDYEKAVQDAPEQPKIVLTHNQMSIHDKELKGRNLVLAGHTHCGQVRVPIITDIILKGTRFGDVIGGRASLENNNELYVTCGITPGAVRLFAPPEISVIYIE